VRSLISLLLILQQVRENQPCFNLPRECDNLSRDVGKTLEERQLFTWVQHAAFDCLSVIQRNIIVYVELGKNIRHGNRCFKSVSK